MQTLSAKSKCDEPRYFVTPLELSPSTPAEVVLELLVRKPGDTFGVARILEAGGIEFWRLGKKVGTFDTFKELYDRADRISL